MTDKKYYTQRDWDRTVGYGKVPYKYSYDAYEDKRAQKILDNERVDDEDNDTMG
jgi:hypothetical protein